MFLRSTVGAGVGPWRRWLLPPDLAAPAAGCFRFKLAHVRVLSIVGFSRYQTKIYGTRQLVHWLQLCSVAGSRRLGHHVQVLLDGWTEKSSWTCPLLEI
jgi:hypothetical protein